MSTLVELFIAFVKIGFTSFGGMSMVPLILEEMRAHQWMSTEDLTNVIAIAEMTPGPLGINCATFAGERTAGVIGGIVAVAGVLMPAFTLTLLTAVCFERFKNSTIFTRILLVLKPICIVCVDFNDDSGASGGKLCCGEQAGSASLWNRNTDDLSD